MANPRPSRFSGWRRFVKSNSRRRTLRPTAVLQATDRTSMLRRQLPRECRVATRSFIHAAIFVARPGDTCAWWKNDPSTRTGRESLLTEITSALMSASPSVSWTFSNDAKPEISPSMVSKSTRNSPSNAPSVAMRGIPTCTPVLNFPCCHFLVRSRIASPNNMTVTPGGPDGFVSWLGGVAVNGPAPVDFDQGDDDRLDVDVDFAFNPGIPRGTRSSSKAGPTPFSAG